MPIRLAPIGGETCRFLRFGSLSCQCLCDRSGSPYHRRGETPPANGLLGHIGPTATVCHSEYQDIEIPARFARQRQEPADTPSRSLHEDESQTQFFPKMPLTQSHSCI